MTTKKKQDKEAKVFAKPVITVLQTDDQTIVCINGTHFRYYDGDDIADTIGDMFKHLGYNVTYDE